jgi:hypothetical protein
MLAVGDRWATSLETKMRSQMIIAAAALAFAAFPALSFAETPNPPGAPVGEFGGGPTVESTSRTFSGYGMGEQPNEATARWCQEMAANGHNRGHTYASWCVQQQPNG